VPISLAIKQNEVFVRKDALYRYAMEMPLDRLLFMPVDPDNGAEFICTEVEFGKLLQDREIRAHTVIRDHNGEIIADGEKDLDPTKEYSKTVNDARSLFYFLKRWHQQPTSLTHARLDDFVEKHAAEARRLGHTWLPSAGAMHRHINKYPDIEQLTARFLISNSGKIVRQRWHPEIAKLLEKIIDWYWEEGSSGRNLNDSIAEFDGWFLDAAARIARDAVVLEPLKKPSDETIRAYINSAECFETVCRKFGKPRADAQFAGNVHPIHASKLLEVVLIDSTVMDTWCVLDDETMLPLGRPTLTIAIDLFTRMILAIIITFEPPSLFTAMACIKRVNMPKDDINERWPNIRRRSDGWGKPGTIVVDNELAQTGKSYQSACEDAKINVKWAPVARPQFKAVVERFFLTLKKMLLDKLPGGVPYKPEIMRQLGIDPKDVATIPLSKLTELVNMCVNDNYHYDPHSTIGMQPALAWEKSKRKHKRPFIGDIDFLDKAFGALRTGTLTTSGIKFENMEFHDPEITGALMDDLGAMAPRRKRRKSLLSSLNPQVMFKYNPANVEAIYVWNKRRKEYVRLPNIAGEAAAGLSIWHWRILRIWAEQESIAFSTPAEQLAARRRLRESVEEQIPAAAYKAIKLQRRILHEPSELIEGKTTLKTQAPPTVGGMAKDDVEIEVAAFAPDGNRAPPPGPTRGRRKGNKVDGRTNARMKEAKQTPPDKPAAKAADVIAAFARDAAKKLASPPVQDAPAASTPGMGASLEEFFRKRNADKTDAGNSNT
jgi:putative transposase